MNFFFFEIGVCYGIICVIIIGKTTTGEDKSVVLTISSLLVCFVLQGGSCRIVTVFKLFQIALSSTICTGFGQTCSVFHAKKYG